MKPPSPGTRDAQRGRLAEAYLGAPQEEQVLLQLLAVLCEDAKRITLMAMAAKTKVRMDDGGVFAQLDIRPLLERLQKKKLAESNNPRHDQGYWKCNDLIMEVAARDAQRAGRFEVMSAAIEALMPTMTAYGSYSCFRSFEHVLRLIRQALFDRDDQRLWTLIHSAADRFPVECRRTAPLWRLCNEPFDAEWFAGLSEGAGDNALWQILPSAFDRLIPAEGAFAYLHGCCTGADKNRPPRIFHLLHGCGLALRGRFSEARATVDAVENPLAEQRLLAARLDLLEGHFDGALAGYERAMAELRGENRRRKPVLYGCEGVFYALALIQSRDSALLRQAAEYLARAVKHADASYKAASAALLRLVDSFLGNTRASNTVDPEYFWVEDALPEECRDGMEPPTKPGTNGSYPVLVPGRVKLI